jgi:hypothetical protein
VAFQNKGLLATEGVFTIPLEEAGGCVPAYRSHFLEFRPVEGDATEASTGRESSPTVTRLVRVHELEKGGSYEVVATTGGGLYRHAMGDRVRVVGRWRGLPLVVFQGRIATSDLVGEKISEADAARALEASSGVFVCAVREDERPHYAVFLEPGAAAGSGDVEREFRRNFHYAHARDLGQLAPPRLYRLSSPLAALRQQAARDRGVNPGDVKPAVLGFDPREGEWLLRRSNRLCEEGAGRR